MAKQNFNNQSNRQSTSNAASNTGSNTRSNTTANSASDNRQTVESAPTADQPTPVSNRTQQFGDKSATSGTAQSPKEDLKQAGREVADDAKRAVDHAARDVKSQADELRREAQGQANNLLNEQKDVAAQRVGGVADALRQAGQGLADRDEEMLAHYTDSLAGQLDNFSNTLRDREIGSLVNDAKQLAHRQPELFVAGALAAGFVLGRFFKSSSQPSASQPSYQSYAPNYPSGGARRFDESYSGESYSGESNGQRYGEPGDYNRSDYNRGASTNRADNRDVANHRDFASRDDQGANAQRNPAFRQEPGQVTTHGLGTGQSIQHQEDLRKGQEFGQGHEQVSSDKDIENSPAAGISTATTKPNTRTDRQEGEKNE